MKLKFILTIFSLVQIVSAADTSNVGSCTTEDFSAELKEVRSQGDVGWCYANAAADMISYKFRKEWGGYQASAIWVALGYNFKQNSDQPGSYIFIEGGDQKYAMSYAGEFGFSCPRNLDNILMIGGLDVVLSEKLKMAQTLKTLFDRKNLSAAHLKAYNDQIQILKNKNSIISLLTTEQLENSLRLPNINLAVLDMAKQFCAPYTASMPTRLSKEMFGRYSIEQNEYYDEVAKRWVSGTPDLIKMIDRQLTENKNVVGIDYKIKLIDRNPRDESSHASVIVGRRMGKTQCQYKIRNSWGPGCTVPDSKMSVPRYGKLVAECEESGHVWVNASDLKANLTDIAYIRP